MMKPQSVLSNSLTRNKEQSLM